MIVGYRDKAPIYLQDIADIEDGLSDYRQLARFNGKTTIGLGMVKVTNTNTVAIVERIRDKLENEIRPQLPPGMIISVVSNDAVFILEIVNSLKQHLVEGTAAGRAGGVASSCARCAPPSSSPWRFRCR